MKTVFNSNSQVCHVWAQQVQSEGRAGSIFFRDSVIFSYGEHFPMAKIYTVKGKRFALINSDTYSVSTGKHKHAVRDALHGLMLCFNSPDIYSIKAAIEWNDKQAKDVVASQLQKMKVTDKSSIKWAFEYIHEAFKEASLLRKLNGRAEIWPKKADLDEVQTHLEKRLVRYRELNTPEMIEKREAEAEKRKERAQIKAEQAEAEKIEKFRRGEDVLLYNLPNELLRIKGDLLQTSRGAEVPLSEAKRLYMAIKNGLDVKGKKVGSFTVEDVTPYRFVNDHDSVTKLVQIGCHKILLSEADRILGVA